MLCAAVSEDGAEIAMKKQTEKENIAPLRMPDMAHDRFYNKRLPIDFRKDIFHKDWRQLWHMHDFLQIWYCISGEVEHTVGEEIFHMQGGDLIIVPVGVPHSFQINSDAELFSLSISTEIFLECEYESAKELFSYSLLSAFSDEAGDCFKTRVISLSENSGEKFEAQFSRLSLQAAPLSELIPEINKLFLLPEFSLAEEKAEIAYTVLTNKVMPLIRAVKYINTHFPEKITTQDLLRVSYLCQTSFFALFKTFMGMRCSYYIQRVRVSNAVFYLAHTSYNISAVSDFCGFNSPSHLVLCHKKQTGVLPNYFRHKLKEFYDKNPELKKNIKF